MAILAAVKSGDKKCDHEWEKKILMVQPQERTLKQLDHGMDYRGGRAAFKLLECKKCHVKEYLEYKVERF